MGAGKLLEEVSGIDRSDRTKLTAPRQNSNRLWLVPGTAPPVGGTSLTVKRDFALRLVAHVVHNDPAEGNKTANRIAARASTALFSDPEIALADNPDSLTDAISPSLTVPNDNPHYPYSIPLKAGPFQPSTENPRIRADLYEARATVTAMISHYL
jgi:hypothetical protein